MQTNHKAGEYIGNRAISGAQISRLRNECL